MTTNKLCSASLFSRIFIIPWVVVLLCCPGRGPAIASSLSVEVQGVLIDIRADQVPLIEILKALSDKTGLLVETGDPLEKPVSLNLKAVPVEACLQRLLIRHNYALTYKKTGHNLFVPVSVNIVGDSVVQRFESSPALKRIPAAKPEPIAPPAPDAGTEPPQADHMKKYEKSWFAQAFEGTDGRVKEIDVEMAEGESEDPSLWIKKVSPDSVFYKIGLREDDRIHNVNGKSIKTAKELIEILQTLPGETLMIRIDRTVQAGRLPIYIELH